MKNWTETKVSGRTVEHVARLDVEVDLDAAQIEARVLGKMPAGEAEAMLALLSRHFNTPVQPIDRYCASLHEWSREIRARANRLCVELYPHIHDEGYPMTAEREAASDLYRAEADQGPLVRLSPSTAAQVESLRAFIGGKARAADLMSACLQRGLAAYAAEVGHVLPAATMAPSETPEQARATDNRASQVALLRTYEEEASRIDGVFRSIRKSSLLARTLYGGEAVRKVPCPEHKGRWSGCELSEESRCPHGCQLTGWLPESKAPQPSVQVHGVKAVMSIVVALDDGYKAIAFDADGTLRRCLVPGQPCPNAHGEWELIPGTRERLASIDWSRCHAGIASNQGGVSRGLLTEEMAYELLHACADAAFPHKVHPSSVLACTHGYDAGCACRKPGHGMLLDLAKRWDIVPADMLYVGDKETDRLAAAAAGCDFAWAWEFFGRVDPDADTATCATR